jgi:hypothetical protein
MRSAGRTLYFSALFGSPLFSPMKNKQNTQQPTIAVSYLVHKSETILQRFHFNCETMESQNTATESPEETRTTRRGWTAVEVRELISIKRAEREHTLEATARGRFRSGQTMWQDVEDAMRRLGFSREWKSCKKKWEVIMTDFRKVYDYDKNLGSGIVSYYMLNEQERLTKRLPKCFPKDSFDALVSWVPSIRAVDPTGINIMDSGVPPVESENVEGLDSGNQANYVDLSEDEDYVHTQSKKKKPRRANLDDEFRQNNENLLSFLEAESSKKTLEASNALAFDVNQHQWEKEQAALLLAQQD